ncbi:hypothetical protein [Glaciimonas sp. PAMC28666]|uniref:hypothetical protein n=1 Tax=Glaciimonas sp. PAMC28666 TaxID=2807626 RepID=UPI0019632E70|nr:hypothetical protein [Glaciimonas sp. PAMC28666]QRX83273.1 hypothetical protein JQN73_03060 [Glaciimonas sp. PAMC28666]
MTTTIYQKAPAPRPAATHKSFSWIHPQVKYDEHADFCALTMDVCQGIQTCIDVAHMSHMNRDNGTAPALNLMDTERLLRLALVSSQMLGEIAAERIEAFNDVAGKEGK